MIGLQTRKIMLQPRILQHGGRAIVAGTKGATLFPRNRHQRRRRQNNIYYPGKVPCSLAAAAAFRPASRSTPHKDPNRFPPRYICFPNFSCMKLPAKKPQNRAQQIHKPTLTSKEKERERERERHTHTHTHTHGHAEAIRERSSATEEETMMFAQAQMRETRNRKSAHRQKRRRRRCQNPSPPDKPTKQGQSVNRHAPSGPSRMDRWMVSGHETVFCWVPVPQLTMLFRLGQLSTVTFFFAPFYYLSIGSIWGLQCFLGSIFFNESNWQSSIGRFSQI